MSSALPAPPAPASPASTSTTSGPSVLRRLVPWLLLATGLAGLCAEVVLGRSLALSLGSSGSAQAITLAAFLGGLALGAVWVERRGRGLVARLGHPLLAWAAAEAVIGVWLVLLPTVQQGVFAALSGLLHGSDPASAAALLAKLLVAALLVLPLSVPMGATLPLLAAAVARLQPSGAVGLISTYYAINAAGGALGAVVAGFWWIEAFGVDVPLILAGMLDLGVAAAVVVWVRRTQASSLPPAGEPPTSAADDAAGPRSGSAAPPLVLVAAAALTGFVTLSLEVVWTRLGGLLLGASVYAFALMLVVVIVGIAAGSALAERLRRRGVDGRRLFVGLELCAAAATLGLLLRLPALPGELLWQRARLQPWPENYPLWLGIAGGVIALHLLPGALMLGGAFPALLSAAVRGKVGADRATAWLLGANTLGNLAGAMVGSFVLMPALGVEGALWCGAALAAVAAALVAGRERRSALAAGVGLLIVVVVGATATPDVSPLYAGLFRQRPRQPADVQRAVAEVGSSEVIFRYDGKDGSVTVDRLADGNLVFRLGGKPDGSTNDTVSQVLLGHLGGLLHPGVRDAMVIGLGTGQSAGAIAAHGEAKVLVAELLRGMEGAARLFSAHNGGVLDNPRVRTVYVDGKELLAAQPPASFDVVVSEPSNPWVVGVADLYTEEHFRRVAERLRPGGLLVQWIQAYEISDELLRDILCTLQRAFPHVMTFRMAPNDLALVASTTPFAIDPAAVGQRLAAPAIQAELDSHHDPKLPRSLDELLLTQLSGPATMAAFCRDWDAPLRERFPRVEYRAPRDFFAGKEAGRVQRFLDRRLEPQGHPLAETLLAQQLRSAPLTVDNVANRARRRALLDFVIRSAQPGEAALRAALGGVDELPMAQRTLLEALPAAATQTADDEARERCRLLRRGGLLAPPGPYGGGATGCTIEGWRARCAGLAVQGAPRR